MNTHYRGLLRPWRLQINRSNYYSAFDDGAHHGSHRYSEPVLDPYLRNSYLNKDLESMLSGTDRPPRYERRSRCQRQTPHPRRSSTWHDRNRESTDSESSGVECIRVLDRRGLLCDNGCSQRRYARFSARTAQTMVFGKAMIQLFRQIVKAEKFYSDFQEGYDEDIKPIKKYARKSTLKVLWVARVLGRKSDDDESDVYAEERSGESFADKFREMNKKLCKALQAAIDSDLHEEKMAASEKQEQSKSRQKAAEQLLGKVEIANEQIVGLLQAAARNRDDSQALLVELRHLRRLINPALGVNKKLYRPGDDDSGGEDGGDGSDAAAEELDGGWG